MNFIRKQRKGTCAAEACANADEKLTGKIWSDAFLWEIFTEAGGKEDTTAKDGAAKLPEVIEVMEANKMIKSSERIYHNPSPHLPKGAQWQIDASQAKAKMIDAIQSPKKALLLAIFTPTGGLKADKGGFPLVGDRGGMHAVYVNGKHLERGRVILDVENSWGPQWGLEGFFKIPLTDLDIVRSAFVIYF